MLNVQKYWLPQELLLTNMLKVLVAIGADMNKHIKCAKVLVAAGANVNRHVHHVKGLGAIGANVNKHTPHLGIRCAQI